jgi:sulfatase maturation enzyme AslB (radical SAM superfamily)
MLKQFGVKTNLSGPQRLDLMFDVGCNLACRTCGPELSTYWQKHMLDHGLPLRRVPTTASRADDMIKLLEQMDLSNLGQVVFCGGETLLGQGYWRVADALADLVPNARDRLTVCFQTNGTQSISDRNYDTIEKFQLVRLNISLDGVGERFNYLRWPATWNQVTDNILKIRQTAPPNVMLLIEETLSIFNLFYTNELKDWLRNNFSTDGRGEPYKFPRNSVHSRKP